MRFVCKQKQLTANIKYQSLAHKIFASRFRKIESFQCKFRTLGHFQNTTFRQRCHQYVSNFHRERTLFVSLKFFSFQINGSSSWAEIMELRFGIMFICCQIFHLVSAQRNLNIGEWFEFLDISGIICKFLDETIIAQSLTT